MHRKNVETGFHLQGTLTLAEKGPMRYKGIILHLVESRPGSKEHAAVLLEDTPQLQAMGSAGVEVREGEAHFITRTQPPQPRSGRGRGLLSLAGERCSVQMRWEAEGQGPRASAARRRGLHLTVKDTQG